MIPVLGVPILNRPELLLALINSTRHRNVDRILVIDNGDVVTPDVTRGLARIIAPGTNLGVAASWNLIIKATPRADYWLIVNSDLTFGPGSLETIEDTVDPDRPALYRAFGLAAFAITPAVIARVGWFDENFHPAYCEDIDYQRRCELAGVELIDIPDLSLTHVGSATIYGDDHYMRQNGRSYPANLAYYEAKWGGRMHTGETFSSAFDEGHEPPLAIERIRELAWDRSPKTGKE